MSGNLASVLTEPPAGHDSFACAVPTTCQPPSAWCKDPWPATIRDINNAGLRLTLNRRFERGSGLAIELPAEDGTMATVLARVVEVSTHAPGQWLLGCALVSELSDEEVRHVLQLDAAQTAPGEDEGAGNLRSPLISGVLFQARWKKGEFLRWFVKQLNLSGSWPLKRGKVVSLSVGGVPAGLPPLELGVVDCKTFGSYHVINCKILQAPAEEVLRAITTPTLLGE